MDIKPKTRPKTWPKTRVEGETPEALGHSIPLRVTAVTGGSAPAPLGHGSFVAIIGMAGRFPGAGNIEQFWRNLANGVESVTFFSDEELLSYGVDAALLSDPHYVKAACMLDGVEWFDARFFGYSPREAEIMDPQHRLFLETAWEAIENAGYNPERYKGSIGVYAGTNLNHYLLVNLLSNVGAFSLLDEFQMEIGNDKDHLATRASYKLNLRGPSITVQTACSTSLVAVHLASQSLLHYECDIALAGGVTVNVPQKAGYLYTEGGVASPDGHCRAFDTRARGTISASGVGVVALKRLTDALADRDFIHAIIRGSAINNDGALKAGYTAPSVEGQAQVIAEALAMAQVDVETISYIETHGTGTSLGDPIEVAALTKCFRARTDKKAFCAIGSVKTNIGHTNTAAGVAGLIKTVLGLDHKLLAPSLHFEQPNPQIDFANSPFYVNTAPSIWESKEYPRRAGVSSFGIGGTNAHLILEEAPPPRSPGNSGSWHLLALSAKTGAALDRATSNLLDHLKPRHDLSLADAAYTLQIGRMAFDHRRTLVCRDLDDAISALETPDSGRVLTSHRQGKELSVVFMFPGQGAQYVNMGLGLYREQPVFRECVDHCSELLGPLAGFDLRDFIYPSEERSEGASERLKDTLISQLSLFVIEYALAKMWMSCGAQPRAMIGHSIGEYVAACIARVFSLEDALKLVAARGRLMQGLTEGSMLAVSLSEDEIKPLLSDNLSLAAANTPLLGAVSGPTIEIEALERLLADRAVTCRRLQTSHAFHSAMMEPILERFAGEVKKTELNAPDIPYISNLTGSWITRSQAQDPAYWVAHLRETVRFSEGIATLLKEELPKERDQVFLEVGPGRALGTFVKLNSEDAGEQPVFSSLPHAQDKDSDVRAFLDALGKLWLAGLQIDWEALHAFEERRRLPLPTYPFERQYYWIDAGEKAGAAGAREEIARKKADLADWFYIPVWKQSLPPALLPKQEAASERSCWLVFASESEFTMRLAARLEREGRDVILVRAGENFGRTEDRRFTIDVRREQDYARLLEELGALNKTPGAVIHAWSIAASEHPASKMAAFELAQESGFHSLLLLTQALGNRNYSTTVRLFVLSNSMQRVTGEDILCPEKATLLGPCRVIAKEYRNMSCRGIDIELPESSARQEENLLELLISEFQADSSDEIVAYRGQARWAPAFEPVRLEGAAAFEPALREQGVYLITDGLGPIGLGLAEYLARTARARLVLIAAADMPQRPIWEKWITERRREDLLSDEIEKLELIEALGAEVMIAFAETSELEQMRQVLSLSHERFGAINGVIHAQSAVGAGLIQLKTREMVDGVLAPSAKAALALDALLEGSPLDFFVLFSSTASIAAGLGQVDTCAACAFLDAFAQYRYSRRALRTVSLNWSGWQWDDRLESMVMMKTASAIQSELKQTRETFGITVEEGVEAFKRALGCGAPQVVISTRDFSAVIEEQKAVTAARLFEELDSVSLSGSKHFRPEINSLYVAPRNELEQQTADLWQELLGIDRIGIYDNFFDLGGHSLIALQLISRLRVAVQTDLPLSIIFEAPTVAALSRAIGERRLGQEELDEIARLLGEIESLSPEEAQHLLAQELQSR